ncbi:hypothetical protein Bpfe_030348, partial [Biomphalaria pfeifferi]
METKDHYSPGTRVRSLTLPTPEFISAERPKRNRDNRFSLESRFPPSCQCTEKTTANK